MVGEDVRTKSSWPGVDPQLEILGEDRRVLCGPSTCHKDCRKPCRLVPAIQRATHAVRVKRPERGVTVGIGGRRSGDESAKKKKKKS